MRLFIAEKPAVAKAIASELGQTGKGDGFIQCGTDTVTWCFGHMLEQAEPHDVPRNGWGDATRARQRADWLIGMNLSRAYTLRAQRKPVPYHTIRAEIQHAGGTFLASWRGKEDQAGIDSEGLIDAAMANALVATVTARPGTVAEYKQEAKKPKVKGRPNYSAARETSEEQ